MDFYLAQSVDAINKNGPEWLAGWLHSHCTGRAHERIISNEIGCYILLPLLLLFFSRLFSCVMERERTKMGDDGYM